METNLYIRIIDTDDNGEYDYKGKMSNSEWSTLMCQYMNEANRNINPWANRVEQFQRIMEMAQTEEEKEYIAARYGYMVSMRQGNDGQYGDMVQDYHQQEMVYDDGYDKRANEIKCRCIVKDCDENEIGKEFFDSHGGNDDAFLLCLSIMPTEEDLEMRQRLNDEMNGAKLVSEKMRVPWEDAESEIKFWMDDSSKLIDDQELGDEEKLKMLPSRPLVFEVGGEYYCVPDNRILELRKEENNPFKFVVLGNKINKLQ